jgi:hypothetical protein
VGVARTGGDRDGGGQFFAAFATEALLLAGSLGKALEVLGIQHNMACTLRLMGRVEQAEHQMRPLIPAFLAESDPNLMFDAEDYAAVLAELGDNERAVLLLGAADAIRERRGTPRDHRQEAEIPDAIAKARDGLSRADLNGAHQAGREVSVEDALIEVHRARSAIATVLPRPG